MLDQDSRVRARVVAEQLVAAFPWGATSEGANFWYDVFGRLSRLSEEGF